MREIVSYYHLSLWHGVRHTLIFDHQKLSILDEKVLLINFPA